MIPAVPKKMISCPNLTHAFSRESNHESGLHLSLDVQACLSIRISNKSCLLSDYQLSIKLMIPWFLILLSPLLCLGLHAHLP